jgi:hypothetical protein
MIIDLRATTATNCNETLLGVIFPAGFARDDLGVLLRAPRDDEEMLLVLTSGETGLALHAAALASASANRRLHRDYEKFHDRGSTISLTFFVL